MTPADVLKRQQAKTRRESLERAMDLQLRAARIPFTREHQFAPPRMWRFDFVIDVMATQIALEVEGGTWSGGRHTTGPGFADDCEKYAEAAIRGWRVIRVTADQVRSGAALRWVERAIGRHA